MKEFKVFYSYDITNGEELVDWKRDTFTVEFEKTADTDYIKERINKIAQDAIKDPRHFVQYANYYKIEEVGL